MLLKNFLRAILPDEGVKCWTSINKDKKARNHFCASIDELAIQIQENDALGVDTYHACATFKTDQNRRGANAGWIKVFMADIDIGEGKPYATVQEAISACDEFCDRVAVPIPGLVASGTGLHAYWVVDRVLSGGEWLPVAQRLKLLMQAESFHADPSRTADIASILRSPGTKNYKLSASDIAAGRTAPAAPRLVEILDPDLFSPISYEEFSQAIINFQHAGVTQNIKAPSVNATFSAGIASKAFDYTTGVKQGSRGSNRVRYAGELVAKGYAFEEVLARVLAWDALCMPPEGDVACRKSVESAFNMHASRHPTPLAVQQALAEEVLPPLPSSFEWGPARQLMVKIKVAQVDGSELLEKKVVCQLPVYLAGWLNEEGFMARNSYLLRHLHPLEGWRSLQLTTEELNGRSFYASLSRKGVSIMPGMDKYFMTYIRAEENMLRLPGIEKTQYTQFGWKDTPAGKNTAFLVGNTLCHADGRVETAIGAPKIDAMMHAMQPARGGSLENWSLAANKLGMPGLEAHLAMAVASFAAPLMKFCVDEGNGGAVLSIVSEDSGKGKTPLATAMASVWGALQSIRSTGNFTGNRLIDDIVCRCNLPQVQEEMNYCDPQVSADGVKKFTSGSDRGRLDQGGNAKGMPNLFQTLLISISNKPFRNIVQMVDPPMACRIFELDINDVDDTLLNNLGGIARQMMANCGYAGRQFARIIVEPTVNQYIREHLQGANMSNTGTTVLKYRQLLNTTAEHRFIVWTLAVIDVAATILNHYKILEFDHNRLMSWLIQQAKGYVLAVPVADIAAMKLHTFLSEHANTCVTVQGPFQPGNGPQVPLRLPTGGKLYMRMEMKTHRLYIATEPLKRWCDQHGMSFIGLGKKLKADGVVLNTCRPVTLGAGTEIVSSRCLCWEIDTLHPQISSQMREELTADKVVPIKAV